VGFPAKRRETPRPLLREPRRIPRSPSTKEKLIRVPALSRPVTHDPLRITQEFGGRERYQSRKLSRMPCSTFFIPRIPRFPAHPGRGKPGRRRPPEWSGDPLTGAQALEPVRSPYLTGSWRLRVLAFLALKEAPAEHPARGTAGQRQVARPWKSGAKAGAAPIAAPP